jgi:hypothetical protein
MVAGVWFIGAFGRWWSMGAISINLPMMDAKRTEQMFRWIMSMGEEAGKKKRLLGKSGVGIGKEVIGLTGRRVGGEEAGLLSVVALPSEEVEAEGEYIDGLCEFSLLKYDRFSQRTCHNHRSKRSLRLRVPNRHRHCDQMPHCLCIIVKRLRKSPILSQRQRLRLSHLQIGQLDLWTTRNLQVSTWTRLLCVN